MTRSDAIALLANVPVPAAQGPKPRPGGTFSFEPRLPKSGPARGSSEHRAIHAPGGPTLTA